MNYLDIIKDGYPRCIRVLDGGVLTIEKDVYIGPFVTIECRAGIHIGEATKIGPSVTIVDFDHNISNIKLQGRKKPISIGKYCWIGANSVILKGVTLGDYCIIGAGSIVTQSFNEGTIAFGNPAEVRGHI